LHASRGRLCISVQASYHIRCVCILKEVFVLSYRSLAQQVVCGCDLVVSICLDALHRVVGVVIELIQHLLVKFIVYWHWLCPWEQTSRHFIFLLFEPWMISDFLDPVSFLWVCVQNLGHKMSCVLRQELWNLIVTSQNFLVEV
jgi:hypothetical protein